MGVTETYFILGIIVEFLQDFSVMTGDSNLLKLKKWFYIYSSIMILFSLSHLKNDTFCSLYKFSSRYLFYLWVITLSLL